MADQVLQVMNQRNRAWDAKKDRDAGNFDYLTCVLHTEGQPEEICDHAMPKPARGEQQVVLAPGFYTFRMVAAVSFEKRLIGRAQDITQCRVPGWLQKQIAAMLLAAGGGMPGALPSKG